jgi:hypothetical protein
MILVFFSTQCKNFFSMSMIFVCIEFCMNKYFNFIFFNYYEKIETLKNVIEYFKLSVIEKY